MQTEEDHVQQDLDKTSELLKVLQRTQRERLAAKLTPAQPLPYAPSEAEHKLGKLYAMLRWFETYLFSCLMACFVEKWKHSLRFKTN